MLSTRITKIIDGLKLPKPERAEINRLLSRPEVQEILKGDETDQIAHRKTLIKEMDDIPGQVAKKLENMPKEVESARKRFDLAEIEYSAAQKALDATLHAATYTGYKDSLRIKEIENELTAGSDPRLRDYSFEVSQIIGRTCMAVDYWIGKTPGNWTGEGKAEVLMSNLDDVVAARVALSDGLAVLRKLELSAITTAETTQALKDLTLTLKPTLKKLNMFPPSLDENNNVAPPHRDGYSGLEEVA